jgi:hypothetical protein
MTESALNRAVARATGETVRCVRNMGFTLHVVPTRRRRPRPWQDAQVKADPRNCTSVAALGNLPLAAA